MTRERLVIGIDVGTSSCKTLALTQRGRVVAEASRTYPTRRAPSGEVSQDPADWLNAVRLTLTAVAGAVDGRVVEGIGITAPAHYAVLLDRQGKPLGRVLLSSDGRPAATAERLRRQLGAGFYETTRVELNAGWTLPQVRWLFDQDQSLPARLDLLLIGKDWIRYKLTGEALTDPSDAAGTALYDQRTGEWSAELLAAAGITPRQVPAIRPAASSGGQLSASWARRVGLPSGIPVVVGATDTAAELVSVGAVHPGDAMVKVASTGTVVVVTAEPRPDPRLLTYPHAVPGRWYGLAATSTAATSDVWLRSVLHGGTTLPGELLRDQDRRSAARVPAGSEGLLFLPFLEGERSPYWDPRLRGAFVGLSSAHHAGHLRRAVLEGVAMSLRTCRDAMREAGLAIHEPVLAGGGLRSPLWRQIVVDVLGQPARDIRVQGPAVGAAMLARRSSPSGTGPAVGTQSTSRASRRQRGRRILPDPGRARMYDGVYEAYRLAVDSIADLSHRLAARRP